ncbi:MAG: orotidine-5'-phosphate decarboxylase [Desulfobacterales bacterium]|nr:orotidine-5'-phosphate decarboxylase [Desulfobacterales bacterium]
MKEPKDYLVFPLDVPTVDSAKDYIEHLGSHVGMFKVGLELFTKAGPEIIIFIKAATDARIFLDLKLHDIPVTVQRAMAVIADMGVDLVTVHCADSREMLAAAVAGAGGQVGVLGVTVLTSISSDDLKAAGYREEVAADINALVLQRATLALETGCTGIVCSGLEVGNLKKRFGGDLLAVTPGIRPAWEISGPDDQKRVVTPAQAIKDGADYLVIGRPIRDANDPVQAVAKVTAEIESGLAVI